MNRAGVVVTAILVSCGYWVGWIHGADVGEARAAPITKTVVAPYPYASVCADMLEAAWSVPPSEGLPHKP